MPFRLRLLLGLLLLSGIGLIGCTENADPIHHHEQQRRDEFKTSPTSGNSETSGNSSTKLKAFASAKDPLLEVLLPWSHVILSNKRIEDLHSFVDPNVRDDLINFNRLLLSIDSSQRSRAGFVDILDRYAEALKIDCDEFLKSCQGIKYFRMSTLSAEVIKLAARQSQSDAVWLLLASTKIKNAYADLELLRDLTIQLTASQKNLDPKIIDSAKMLLVETIAQMEGQLKTEAEIQNFLTSIQSWRLLIRDHKFLDKASKSALWRLTVRGRLLNDHFNTVLNAHMLRSDSIRSAQDQLTRDQLFNPEALGAKILYNFNFSTYILDRVFLGDLDSDLGSDLLDEWGIDIPTLTKNLKEYVQIRFMETLHHNTKLAKSIFNDPSVPTEKMFRHTLTNRDRLRSDWDLLRQKLSRLQSLGLIIARHQMANANDISGIQEIFHGLNHTIRISAELPHTLLMFHYLSQKSFKLSIWIMTLDSADIIRILFFGDRDPILSYTDDPLPINHYDMIHAFDMAVRTGLLRAVGIDPDVFLSDTIARLSEKSMIYIRDELLKLQRTLTESQNAADFKNACAELKTGMPRSRTVDLAAMKRSPYLGDLFISAFESMSSASSETSVDNGGLTIRNIGLSYPDIRFAESAEKVRMDLELLRREAEAMLTAYDGHLRRYEFLDDQQVTARTEKTRNVIRSLVDRRDAFVTKAKELEEAYGSCYIDLGIADRDFKDKLFLREVENLKQIHRDILALRSAQTTELEKTSIRQKYRFSGLPSNFGGLDQIYENGYLSNQIDFLLRLAKYTESLAPNLKINYGTRLDLDNDLVKNSRQAFISFTDSEDEFVLSGIRIFFASVKNTYLGWGLLQGRVHLDRTEQLLGMTSLYRLFSSLNAPESSFSPKSILDRHLRSFALSQFTASDKIAMDASREMTKFDLIYFSNRFLVFKGTEVNDGGASIQDVWGLFDLPVKLAAQQNLGQDYTNLVNDVKPDPEFFTYRHNYLELGRLYYNSRSRDVRGSSLIRYNATLDRLLDRSIGDWIRSEHTAIQSFQNYAIEYTSQFDHFPPEQRPYIDVATYLTIRDTKIRPSLISNFDVNWREFNQSTQNCFADAAKPCANFQ